MPHLSNGNEVRFSVGGATGNCYPITILILSKEGVALHQYWFAVEYWAYSSCGSLLIRGLSGLSVQVDLYKEVYKLLYEYLTGPGVFTDGYSRAGQLTWMASDNQMKIERSWQRYMIEHHDVGVTKCVHEFYNMAHPVHPEDHKSGSLMKVFWHNKYPESLPS